MNFNLFSVKDLFWFVSTCIYTARNKWYGCIHECITWLSWLRYGCTTDMVQLKKKVTAVLNILKLSGHTRVHAEPSKTIKMTPTGVQGYTRDKLSGHSRVHAEPSRTIKMTPTGVQGYTRDKLSWHSRVHAEPSRTIKMTPTGVQGYTKDKLSGHSRVHAEPSRTIKMTFTGVQGYTKDFHCF